jgi:hypothetical protein
MPVSEVTSKHIAGRHGTPRERVPPGSDRSRFRIRTSPSQPSSSASWRSSAAFREPCAGKPIIVLFGRGPAHAPEREDRQAASPTGQIAGEVNW